MCKGFHSREHILDPREVYVLAAKCWSGIVKKSAFCLIHCLEEQQTLQLGVQR